MTKSTTTADRDALIEIDRGMVGIGKFFSVTPIGLTFKGKPPLDVCGDMCELLRVFEGGMAWCLGDFINQVESLYSEEASQIIDASQLSESTARVYSWVAKNVPLTVRREELPFSSHQLVAGLPHEEQRVWLQRAVDGDEGESWSSQRLKKELAAAKSDAPAGAKVDFLVIAHLDSAVRQQELVRQLANLGVDKVTVKP